MQLKKPERKIPNSKITWHQLNYLIIWRVKYEVVSISNGKLLALQFLIPIESKKMMHLHGINNHQNPS